jgi:hypothetical protein
MDKKGHTFFSEHFKELVNVGINPNLEIEMLGL